MSNSLIIELTSPGVGRVAGRIDVDNAAIALIRGSALQAGGRSLEVDLAELHSADSVTLAVLLEWAAQARTRGNRLIFRQASSRLRAIAHLSDAEQLLGLDSSSA